MPTLPPIATALAILTLGGASFAQNAGPRVASAADRELPVGASVALFVGCTDTAGPVGVDTPCERLAVQRSHVTLDLSLGTADARATWIELEQLDGPDAKATSS